MGAADLLMALVAAAMVAVLALGAAFGATRAGLGVPEARRVGRTVVLVPGAWLAVEHGRGGEFVEFRCGVGHLGAPWVVVRPILMPRGPGVPTDTAAPSPVQAWPTSNRANRCTVMPASSNTFWTVFFWSVTDGCSTRT